MQAGKRNGIAAGIAVGGMLWAVGMAQAQTLPLSDTYAIVGARIEIGDGRVLEKGTVLLRDGLIEAVGKDIAVPPDAEVIKGDGLTVYPGFVDGCATSGLKLPDWQPDQDTPPDSSALAAPSMREANRKGIRPELRAVDCFALTEAVVSPIRKMGFTTELLTPTGGSINGMSALVNLSGKPKREAVIRADVAQDMAFATTGSGYPGTLLGIFSLLRQTFLDARYFRVRETAFANGGGQRPPADDGLAALLPVLDGKIPALFEADSENQILRAVKLTDEFGMKLIVNGGGEAFKAAPLLAKRQIPVLVSLKFDEEPGGSKTPETPTKPSAPMPGTPPAKPSEDKNPPKPTPPSAQPDKPLEEKAPPDPNKPGGDKTPPKPDATAPDKKEEDADDTPKAVIADRHKKWEDKVANAAKLQQSGVTFAFTTRGVKDLSEFWKNLRRAIKAGLPKEAALRALTLDAARIFGVDRQMGTVEPGKIAALVVMSGDFSDEKSKVKFLFIDRSKFDPDNDRPARPPLRPMFPGDEDAR